MSSCIFKLSLFISFFALGINDLNAILNQLGQFHKREWKKFGLKAGLYPPTLSTIEANHSNDCEECFSRCLSLWLQRADNVDGEGKPTWQRLADILEEMGYKAVADTIRNNKGQNNNVFCMILVELVIRNISEDGSSMGHDVMIYCILSVSTLVTIMVV